MLNVIVFILAFLIIAVFGVFYHRENKRKRASDAILKKRLASVEGIKSGFKNDLERLTELGVLSEPAQNAIFRLASHYFIFQPANPESLKQCESDLKSLLMAIREKMQDTGKNNLVAIRLLLDDFANALPRKVDGYNALFYSNKLPLLIQKLVDADTTIDQESGSIADPFL